MFLRHTQTKNRDTEEGTTYRFAEERGDDDNLYDDDNDQENRVL